MYPRLEFMCNMEAIQLTDFFDKGQPKSQVIRAPGSFVEALK
jgi:hypothetical protein